MNPLLQELLTNAESRNHVIEFEIKDSAKVKIVASFNMHIMGNMCRAVVEANTRAEAIEKVRNSGVPIKSFTKLH
ncbi:hypothetical protein CMI37_29990 [Candidatus Pacearchaeota archaeon]|nr:hypothetical protein [Candidatus Pacearchaeota archaeon]